MRLRRTNPPREGEALPAAGGPKNPDFTMGNVIFSHSNVKRAAHLVGEPRSFLRSKNERVKGIEPSWPAWKAGALPLSYTRMDMKPCGTVVRGSQVQERFRRAVADSVSDLADQDRRFMFPGDETVDPGSRLRHAPLSVDVASAETVVARRRQTDDRSCDRKI